jgi:hypothetical protein
MKMLRIGLVTLVFLLGAGCTSKYEKGGKCYAEPGKYETELPCPPPLVWWAEDPDGGAGEQPIDERDPEIEVVEAVDGGSV